MTDGNTGWGSPSGAQPERPNRGPLVAGAVVATLLLATIGATGGYLIAKAQNNDSNPVAEEPAESPSGPPTSRPAPTATKTSRAAPPPHPTKTTPSKLPPGQFALPNLVGQNFEDAREELRAKKLGWQLVFGVAGDDGSVSSTRPPAGTGVRQGDTVVITVVGAAPSTVVPTLTGKECDEAADKLGDAGLYPQYPEGKDGQVNRQVPEPGTELRWNDEVRIYCGQPDDGEN